MDQQLKKWKIKPINTSFFGKTEVETILHLFWGYVQVQELWELLFNECSIDPFQLTLKIWFLIWFTVMLSMYLTLVASWFSSGTELVLIWRQAFIHYCGLHQVTCWPGRKLVFKSTPVLFQRKSTCYYSTEWEIYIIVSNLILLITKYYIYSSRCQQKNLEYYCS